CQVYDSSAKVLF
nr:immunoglobulin light chain junction region [Macaca mulatta]MPO03862.1 immunoglobulin light chain junction region [Macaca mulatta]MPO03949.1 immunoglobulin light chain junction region [Macaca mulatta]MPO04323.1 immunoglobulin light chain junction region [Macaca mulatta]MPO04448.1 immunoglobulin light chain junction region [Macaca mulatta]